MRRKFFISSIIPLLFLLMLGGCLGPDYLVTSTGPAALEEATNLREGEPHYTAHHAVAAKPEIVRIAINDQFDMYQRAKILRAVNEWNHVLNGFVRLDADPAADKEPVWIIVPVRGGRPPPAGGMIVGHALKPPMGYAYYSKISADDMAALIAWLRSLPAKKTP